MKAFYGGQIKEQYRGDLVAVITRGEKDRPYSIFVYPINSEEFVHLTGVGSVNRPVERAYIGVTSDAGNSITKYNEDLNRGDINLKRLDYLIVTPHFLKTNIPLPQRMVLEASKDGMYKVTEMK